MFLFMKIGYQVLLIILISIWIIFVLNVMLVTDSKYDLKNYNTIIVEIIVGIIIAIIINNKSKNDQNLILKQLKKLETVTNTISDITYEKEEKEIKNNIEITKQLFSIGVIFIRKELVNYSNIKINYEKNVILGTIESHITGWNNIFNHALFLSSHVILHALARNSKYAIEYLRGNDFEKGLSIIKKFSDDLEKELVPIQDKQIESLKELKKKLYESSI